MLTHSFDDVLVILNEEFPSSIQISKVGKYKNCVPKDGPVILTKGSVN